MAKYLKPALDRTIDQVLSDASKAMDLARTNPAEAPFLQESSGGNPITLGPAVLSPEEWAEKQQKRALAGADEWLKNTLKPSKVPSEAAAMADGKRRRAVEKSEKEGRWLKAMNAVNAEETLETIKKVGVDGYKRGIEARIAKITRVYKELQPMVAALQSEIAKMPEDTEEQRIARMLATVKGMKLIGQKRLGITGG